MSTDNIALEASATESFGSDTGKPVPTHVAMDRTAKLEIPEEPNSSREERAEAQISKLPKPQGYKVLLIPFSPPKKSRGGIHYSASTLKTEDLTGVIGYVIAVGSGAYKDPDKFPDGAWCKKGDYVIFGRYAGAKIVMTGENDDDLPLRILNDDEILATIDNPEDYVGIY